MADPEDRQRFYRDADHGTVMLAEFLAAPLVWGGIGWAVDTYLLHRPPWGLIVGLLLGFTLGTYLLYLRMQAQGRIEDERRLARRTRTPHPTDD